MVQQDYALLTASAAASAIADGELTSTALVEACLARIEAREEIVGAWAHLEPGQALAQARARDTESPRGPLHGIPIAIKDIVDTQSMPTNYGCAAYQDHFPATNALAVDLLEAAGAVIMGKTVTTEFANYAPGKTSNPHNPLHTPGGSSSGSAAAIADFHVPLALGTQTSGSIIRPASFNGILGYKPSFGDFPIQGVRELALAFDTLGGFARSFADLVLLRGVLAAERQPISTLVARQPRRVGLMRTPHWPDADAEMRTALENFAAVLSRASVEVNDVELPEPFSELADAHQVIFSAQAAESLDRELQAHGRLLRVQTRELIEAGFAQSFSAKTAAKQVIATCRDRLAGLLSEYDVLLTPGAPGPAPLGLEWTGDPIFNRLWTAAHVPCVGFPITRSANGLPIGAQLVGARGTDDELLAKAWWIQSQADYTIRPPND